MVEVTRRFSFTVPDDGPVTHGVVEVCLRDHEGAEIVEIVQGESLIRVSRERALAIRSALSELLSGSGLGDTVCYDCGAENPVWFAPNDVWNRVVGGEGAKGDPGGVVCPACFIGRAATAGISPPAWLLSPS